MLILLRRQPDARLQEVISSVVLKEPGSRLVYLEHSLEDLRQGSALFHLPGMTASLDPTSCDAIDKIDPAGLLGLIRDNPGIIVLP